MPRTAAPPSPLDIIYSEEGFKHKEVAVRLDELMKDDQDAAEGLNSAPGGPSTPTPKRLYVYEHKIPRIIHQMWKTTRVMRVFKPFIASWARLHPFWEYRFWTDASGEQFVKTVYPQHWEMFKEFNGIQRSDALRYFILHRYGGVYADLDVEAVAPLDVILDRELILSQEPLAHAVVLENRKRQVCNAFMASAPGHPFWPYVHEYMAGHQVRRDPVGSTGPRMLDAALTAYRKNRTDTALERKTKFYRLSRRDRQRERAQRIAQRAASSSGGASSSSSSSVGGGGSMGGLTGVVDVAPPRRFMPLFDDKLNNFRQKCNKWGLSKRQKAHCKAMAAKSYRNDIDSTTLTVHHWSHTWLGHVKEDDLIDVWEVVNTTRDRKLDNTVFGDWIEEPQQHKSTRGKLKKIRRN